MDDWAASIGPHRRDGASTRARWHADADRLWDVWRSLPEWEERVDIAFDAPLGGRLLVLWAISRLAGSGEDTLLRELIDEDIHPRFGEPLLEDMVCAAFAMGAAWCAAAKQEGKSPAHGERPRVVHGGLVVEPGAVMDH